MFYNPKISIIIATYNAESCIEQAIQSVIAQTYVNKELIIVDGGSTDDTLNIIKSIVPDNTQIMSEKDNGIYDAWNKGIKMSKGDWLIFIGADDVLLKEALEIYIQSIITNEWKDVDIVTSKCEWKDMQGKRVGVKGKAWSWPAFKYTMTIAHPGAMHARSLFYRVGYFNDSYKITADYELLLRAGYSLKAAFVNSVTVSMRKGGVSDSVKAIAEYFKVIRTTGNVPLMLAGLSAFLLTVKYYGGKIKRAFV